MNAKWLILTVIAAEAFSGCITTEESYEQTRDPFYSQEAEQQLKTDEDWERWHKQQRHNKNAAIFIPGSK